MVLGCSIREPKPQAIDLVTEDCLELVSFKQLHSQIVLVLVIRIKDYSLAGHGRQSVEIIALLALVEHFELVRWLFVVLHPNCLGCLVEEYVLGVV